jgi:hypothetical protein
MVCSTLREPWRFPDSRRTSQDKSGWGASRANLQAKLVIERLTGRQEESFTNAAMQWGVDKEDDARTAYSFVTGNDVLEVGLYKHPTIIGSHASPDGLVGDDGCIEIKCPNSSTHIDSAKERPNCTQISIADAMADGLR